jgi:hypothetical protein
MKQEKGDFGMGGLKINNSQSYLHAEGPLERDPVEHILSITIF